MRRRLIMAACTSLAALLFAPVAGAAQRTPTSSPFPYRGIIEGFYGTPYNHAERVDLIRWEAAHSMNIFVDAPKEDPYVRSLWRHQYPPAELTEMLSEVRLAARLGVAWVPDVGPGIAEIPSPNVAVPDRDICFSCPSDLALLVAKFKPFVDAGARMVMVSFDDTVKASSWPQDASAYGTGDAAYGTMNAELLDRLAKALPGVTILTVPSDYSGTSSTAYLSAFSAHLDPGIVVMWTGTQVIATAIKGSDAAAFDKIVHRRVVVWDNYPVNDYAGGIVGDPTNLFLGPVVGRGPDLVGKISGILANPAVEWQASKVPLATLADDLKDPYTYNPEASWRAALDGFAGRSVSAFSELADNMRSSTLGQSESIVFEPDATAFLSAFKGAAWPAAAGALAAELVREKNAPAQLRASQFNPEFMNEAAPFLNRLELNASAGLAALSALEAQRPAISARLQKTGDGKQETISGSASPANPSAEKTAMGNLVSLAARLATDDHNVHGDRFAADDDGNIYAARKCPGETPAMADPAWAGLTSRAAQGLQVVTNKRCSRHAR
jgi:hyaluronoglucosaminidase